MLAPPSPQLHLHPQSPAPRWATPPDPAFTHYRTSPAFTFHAYSPPASPLPEDIAPPAMSTKRASRLSAPFPTFLYANEPPPVTARNKQRVRPSPAQLADLKSLYAATAHPTREEREALGRRIGMRYQSVTNWFQNQRSTAKKRGPMAEHHDDDEHDDAPAPPRAPTPAPAPPPRRPRTDPVRDIIAQASARPAPTLPLPLSGANIVMTLPPPPPHRAAPALVSSFQVSRPPTPAPPPKRDHSRERGHRGKRSRPTPHQLAVLRALHAATVSPSIEERVRVGRDIGMELGKVTNWFRNLRQTARKKERRALEEEGAARKRPRTEDGDGDGDGAARKRARHGDDDGDDSSDSEMEHESSELGTESDAAHEAVTPEPLAKPLLPAQTQPPQHPAPPKRPAASVDDALLLLALHAARA